MEEKDFLKDPLISLSEKDQNTNHFLNLNNDEEESRRGSQLLLNSSTANNNNNSETPVVPGQLRFKTALKTIISNTLPMVILNLITFSIRNLSLHLIKEENNNDLTDAVGIGNTLLNMITIALFMSFNTGLTSGSAQAFGAKNYQLMGFYLHRGLVINIILLIPGSILLYFSDKISITLGFNSITANYVQEYTSYSIIGVVALMIYNTLTAYLNACDIFWAPSVVQVISAATFWILSIVLVEDANMGLMGVIISFNVMQTMAAVLMFVYILIKNPVPGSFFWFKKGSFQGLWKFFKYEFFVGSMVFLEWIAYQIIYLFSGKLTVEEISALTIVYTNFEIWYALPLSLSDTVLAFVGNAVGEGDVKKAKTFLKAGLLWNTCSILIVEIFYVFFSHASAEFYTDDESIISQAVFIFRVYMIYYPIDFTQIILSSGMRALGKEKLGSLIFIVSYYLVSIPACYLLCFVADLGLKALIFGPIIGLSILFIWVVAVYCRLDWKKQVDYVLKRVGEDNNSLP